MQPEARISQAIRNLIKQRGGFAFKVWGNAQMLAGLPDIVGVYRGAFIGFEVKTPTGRVSPRQRYVLRAIVRAGGIVAVPRSVSDARNVLDDIDVLCDACGDVTDDLRPGLSLKAIAAQ